MEILCYLVTSFFVSITFWAMSRETTYEFILQLNPLTREIMRESWREHAFYNAKYFSWIPILTPFILTICLALKFDYLQTAIAVVCIGALSQVWIYTYRSIKQLPLTYEDKLKLESTPLLFEKEDPPNHPGQPSQ